MRVRFEPRIRAHSVLNERVAAYMLTADVARIQARMLVKTFVILAWAVISYLLLAFVASNWWQVGLASVSLGLAMSGIGFSIMHDGNHGAYPLGPKLNRLAGFCLDVLGGSSYLWRFKHNINHHTFTNIHCADADIDLTPLARMSPEQPRRVGHRFQHIYVWGLYCLLAFRWILISDWAALVSGRIGENEFPRPSGSELVILIAGKVIAFALWSSLFFLHPWKLALFGTLSTAVVLGFTLAMVFQLAHVVEKAEFPPVFGDPARSDNDWFSHQLATTADFAPRSPMLTWYLGGLNYQVVHHLFPKVCHLHYPDISAILEQTCVEFELPYYRYPTLLAALGSHYRWLHEMGNAPS